jgi:hypothetical protein
MHHRYAKVFRGRLPTLLADSNVVGRSVVLDHVRMIHRHVGGALLEVSDGITTNLHEVGDETVGFDHGALGVVHEASLIRTPRVGESIPVLGRERLDVQLLNALDAVAELTLGVARVAVLADESLVLGTELPSQLFRTSLLDEHERDDDHGQRNEHADDDSRVE